MPLQKFTPFIAALVLLFASGEGFAEVAPSPAIPPPRAIPVTDPAIAPATEQPAPANSTLGTESAAEPKVARAAPVDQREVITQLQIFLDQKNFGPGKIDGRWGEFTGKAIAHYQRAHGLAVTGKIDPNIPFDSVYPIYSLYQITGTDTKVVGVCPTQPSEQAKLKVMPYPSLLEFVAERYHSDPDFIARLNKGKNMEDLKPGDIVRVPNVAPFRIEEMKEIGGLPERAEFEDRTIYVDTKEKMLDLYDGRSLIASFPITPGSSALPAPPGVWMILGIAEMPWFRWDKRMLMEGKRSSDFFNIPAGPRNPVGVLWCGLDKPGIGIHGTNSPFTIGRSGSHGCIRLANWDAAKFAGMVTKNMTVTIE